MFPVLIGEDSRHDGVLPLGNGFCDGVPMFCSKEISHGFSNASFSGWEASLEVIPSEVPGEVALWAENLSVPDGELWPIVVISMGVEGVPWYPPPAPVVIFEQVELVVLYEPLLIGEEVLSWGV